MKYQTPFSSRYGSSDMRSLWSIDTERKIWRKIWSSVASVQAEAGIVQQEQLADILKYQDELDLARSKEIEREISHDLMAELRVYADQCSIGGGVLHWGLTSADVKDNCDAIRQKTAATILLSRLRELLLSLSDRIEETANLVILGYTHLQPAEPTTLGYRLSLYAQDLLNHFESLLTMRAEIRGKGIKGAVGTSASLKDILEGSPLDVVDFEAKVMDQLDLQAHPITTQTYPRVQDYKLLAAISALAGSLHKFGTDMRLMQSPGFRTATEPFGENQVGSSAMPFKQNPILAERLCSLTRLVPSYAQTAWENAANSMLERTLDDSANRRTIIPESFLACEEALLLAKQIMDELHLDKRASRAQLEIYGPFAALERLLNDLVREGANRQEMHELLRVHSMKAWESIENGNGNPLLNNLKTDTKILKYVQPARIESLLESASYTGLASQRALDFVEVIYQRFNSHIKEQSGP